MRYFTALKVGQKRVAKARDYLGAIAGDGALPALALRNTTNSASWEPVGEETMYAFVSDAPGFVLADGGGYLLALVDSEGMAKAIVQNVTEEQKKRLLEDMDIDGLREFRGEVTLPV